MTKCTSYAGWHGRIRRYLETEQKLLYSQNIEKKGRDVNVETGRMSLFSKGS